MRINRWCRDLSPGQLDGKSEPNPLTGIKVSSFRTILTTSPTQIKNLSRKMFTAKFPPTSRKIIFLRRSKVSQIFCKEGPCNFSDKFVKVKIAKRRRRRKVLVDVDGGEDDVEDNDDNDNDDDDSVLHIHPGFILHFIGPLPEAKNTRCHKVWFARKW